MKQHIQAYIESKQHSWADTTKKSEGHRLEAVKEALDGNPETLWKAISDRAPYTRLTIWTRVADFWEFLIEEKHTHGPNPYKVWKKRNAKVFKHVYQANTPSTTFEGAKKLINTIGQEDIRNSALQLLEGGLRVSERDNVTNGSVVGKGGKSRKVFLQQGSETKRINYQALRRALALLGLKPHDLRKIRATQLARQGMQAQDLCKVFGWSSFATAKAYIAPMNDDAIKAVMCSV